MRIRLFGFDVSIAREQKRGGQDPPPGNSNRTPRKTRITQGLHGDLTDLSREAAQRLREIREGARTIHDDLTLDARRIKDIMSGAPMASRQAERDQRKGNHEALHDFNDGKGPIPAHQHMNPDGRLGGWVANSARVHPTTFVEPSAQVMGKTTINKHVRIHASAKIYEGVCVGDFVDIGVCTEIHTGREVGSNAKIGWNSLLCGPGKIGVGATLGNQVTVDARVNVRRNANVPNNTHLKK